MSTYVLTDAVVTINSVDLSDDISAVTLDLTSETQDDSAMGDSWRSMIPGVKSGTVSFTFNQDFAASQVDATLWAAFGTEVPITIKPTSAATGATNPSYEGNVVVNQYSPIANSFGELATTSPTWPTTGAVTRETS